MAEQNQHTEAAYQIICRMGQMIQAERTRESVNVQRLYTQCEQLMKLASAELTLSEVAVSAA